MNRVFNINLGGYPFVIDVDAYEHLDKYLKTIHHHFEPSEGYEEITSDIEARMAELFQERMQGREIVTLRDVKAAISIMGTPEDFGAEIPEDDSANYTKKEKSEKGTYSKVFTFGLKTGKRLFRNPDDEVVGGVCSGIAAYFGIQDPLWIRLLFVVVTLSGGFGIPLYIILWAILPKAESASDRLAMKGEPINVSNIGKLVEEEMENLSQKMTELSEDLNEKFGSKKKDFQGIDPSEVGNKAKGVLRKVVGFIGKVIMAVITIIKKIGRPLLIIIAFALMLAFAVSWIASMIGLFFSFPFFNFILPEKPILPMVGTVNILTIIGVPLVALILVVMRSLFHFRMHPNWRAGLWSFWVLNIVSLVLLGIFVGRQFGSGTEMNPRVGAIINPMDTLRIELADNPYQHVWQYIGDDLQISGDRLISNDVFLKIEKSRDEDFELLQSNFSRGENMGEASQLASEIRYQPKIENNILVLPQNFHINKGEKWRNQKIYLTLKVPVGKAVHLSDDVNDIIRNTKESEGSPHIWHHNNKKWTMQEDGLSCLDCDQRYNGKKLSSYVNFSKLHLEGGMKVEITRSPNFSVRMTGRPHYTDRFDFAQMGETLSVTSDLNHHSSPVRLYITMPKLNFVAAEDTDDIKISGFEQQQMTIQNKSKYDVKAFVNIDSLTLKQTGRGEIDVRGEGNYLSANLDDRARLDTEHYSVSVAEITATHHSRASIAVADTVRQVADSSSKIRIDGQPMVITEQQGKDRKEE